MKAEQVDDTFRIDNHPLHTIKLIGTIETCDQHSTNNVYTLNDNTGVITCKLWNEKDPALSAKYSLCTVGTLVCVIGMLKDFENKKHVQIVSMRPITDWNERTHHFLECVFTHLQVTRGPIPGTVVKQDFSHSLGTPAMAAMEISSTRRDKIIVEGQEMNPHKNVEVTKLFSHIIKQFHGVDAESGLEKTEMMSTMMRQGVNVNAGLFNEAIKFLAEQGHLYSTLNENTYACTLFN
jgi:replication factor A2